MAEVCSAQARARADQNFQVAYLDYVLKLQKVLEVIHFLGEIVASVSHQVSLAFLQDKILNMYQN